LAAALAIDDGAQVRVALDGGALQRADDGLKVYAGDRVVADSGRFSLLFFDGTLLRGDAGTDVSLQESARGIEQSTIDVRVAKGRVWVRTPSAEAFSGAILRTVETAAWTLQPLSGTELVVDDAALAVFESDGPGVAVTTQDNDMVVIGEGQEYRVALEGEEPNDPYALRAPLSAEALASAFLADSRSSSTQGGVPVAVAATTTTTTSPNENVLTLLTPEENTVIVGTTVRITGTIGDGVTRVRVNGYQATVDLERRTFSQELAVPDSETVDIRVEAMDARGLTLQETQRTLRRTIQAPPQPTITEPAPAGSVYRTNAEQFTVRGTAPAGIAGIVVNDYRLQLFKKGDTTWSYIANVKLGNAVRGENIIDAWSIDAAGNRSDPVRITVIVGEGEEGIVSGPSSAGATASAASSVAAIDPSQLPSNAPLQPGSVTITAPVPGTSATMTGTELLLEGTSPAEAASLWVNDYKLQLFSPAKRTWTYIAREEWGTVKVGTNTYVITARDAEDKILDRVTYTVEKR
jgi:hypothetical protein